MYSKELLKGTLKTIILKLLSENDRMYGYQITQKVKEITEGKINLTEGALYPALHKLMKEGVLSYEEEFIGKRVRKYYFLTSSGKEQQKASIVELKDFLMTLSRVFDQDLKLSIG